MNRDLFEPTGMADSIPSRFFWISIQIVTVYTRGLTVTSNVTVHTQCHLLKQKIIQKLRLETEMRST